jgi:hypothetical protein
MIKMITQTIDPHHFVRRSRQIKARIPFVLAQWGLLPRFKRWRLAQDPDTGMVVLFGVLNTKYIATHTTTPFSNYFDPRLLHDMTKELQVRVISSANDGLRYAFILDKGLPDITQNSRALMDSSGIGTISTPGPAEPREPYVVDPVPPQPNNSASVNNHGIPHQRLDRFLKIAAALEAMENAPTQPMPEVLLTSAAEFNQQMAEYEASRNNNNPQRP